MSGDGAVDSLIMVLVVVGAVCLFILFVYLWNVRGGGEAPIGPRRAPRPAPPGASLVPADFRILLAGETRRWKQRGDWGRLVARLDELAQAHAVGPAESPAPKKYSASWLDERLTQIEAVAGTPTPPPEPRVRRPIENTSRP